MSRKIFFTVLLLAICLTGFLSEQLKSALAQTDSDQGVGGEELWKTALSYYEVSSPIVSDGLVYTSSSAAPNGGSAVSVYCLNGSTGEIIWQVTGEWTKLAVSRDYVYVSYKSIIHSIHGNYLSCLDAQTGTQLWNFTDGNNFSKPLVKDGVVYIGGTSDTATSSIIRTQGYIYALNASTGALLWEYKGPGNSGFSNSIMLLDSYLCATGSEGVYALDPSDGALNWRYATNNLRSIDCQNGTVFTTRYEENDNTVRGEVNAFSEATGEKLWSYTTAEITKIHQSDQYRFIFPIGTPIVDQNTVYIAAQNGDITALKTVGGQKIWQRQLNTTLWQRETPTSPTIGDGKVFIGCPAGIYCLNAGNGDILWEQNENTRSDTLTSYPAYSEGVIYVGFNIPVTARGYNEARNFYAFNADSGSKLWNYSLYDRFLSVLVIVNDTVYAGGDTENFRGLVLEPAVLVALKACTAESSSLTDTENTQSQWTIAAAIGAIIVIALLIAVKIRGKKGAAKTRRAFQVSSQKSVAKPA